MYHGVCRRGCAVREGRRGVGKTATVDERCWNSYPWRGMTDGHPSGRRVSARVYSSQGIFTYGCLSLEIPKAVETFAEYCHVGYSWLLLALISTELFAKNILETRHVVFFASPCTPLPSSRAGLPNCFSFRKTSPLEGNFKNAENVCDK